MAPPALFALLLFHVFFPVATAAEIAGFWSINCGGSKPFTRSYGVPWHNDSGYVRAGESHPIRKSIRYLPPELKNLRAFPSRRKNCFTIPVEKGSKLLARVKFYYGDYDKLNKPPSFDLILDADRWTTVSTKRKKIIMYEAVYVARRNGTSICVGRKEDGPVPFVSSIEIRTLADDMYGAVGSDRALYLARSVAYGAKKNIRYPDDPFDRVWTPKRTSLDGTGFAFVPRSNKKIISNNSSSPDQPPLAAFDSAAKPPKGETNLTIQTTRHPLLFPSSIYVNMYFTEMGSRKDNESIRSFHVYMGGSDRLTSDASSPIVPPFGRIRQLTHTTTSASSRPKFDLVPTPNSTLPPTINAMELFSISAVLNHFTNITDVRGLAALQRHFSLLQNWTGDPCRPEGYNWEWVTCNKNSTPRITQLRLSAYGLSGHLPNFTSLTALEMIYLDGNSLTGAIPEFLGRLPHLKILSLADNDFATIPDSLLERKDLTLDISGNSKLCSYDDSCELEEVEEANDDSSAVREHGKFTIKFFTSLATVLLLFMGVA